MQVKNIEHNKRRIKIKVMDKKHIAVKIAPHFNYPHSILKCSNEKNI